MPMPSGYYRVRVTKDGYLPLETTTWPVGGSVVLAPAAGAPPDMVFVPGGPSRGTGGNDIRLPDFWIDKFEVSNAEYKRFVDAGGYRDPRFWKIPFEDQGRTLPFEEAMTRFVDSTGRPGPASWELAAPPAGQDTHPVSGISWFEAAAYADFAHKALPTVYHWNQVASTRDELFSEILLLSNFDNRGSTGRGERQGLSPFGTFDMAGNVKEWVRNEERAGGGRYILGGAWNEPSYRYAEIDVQNPWLREPTFGMRLVSDAGPLDARALAPVANLTLDPASVVPVDARELEFLERFYEYDRSPLNARVDASETTAEWRKETITVDAAYGGERVTTYLFLPNNPGGAKPPYQAVVIFPSSYATLVSSSAYLDYRQFDFIVKSGRAAIYTVYQGTFERRVAARGPAARRDMTVQRVKDLFRTVDYLTTREDIDRDKLGYFSVSMGAFLAPVPLALEPRIKAAVLASGGLSQSATPEISPANFAPAVTIPVLLVNGRDDFRNPPASRDRFLALLGTPAADKQQVALEGGHFPQDIRSLVRHTLDWFDKYLGPVR
jgi:dienelactone hydrolase